LKLAATQPSHPCPCGRVSPSKKPMTLANCCGRFIDHFEDTPAPDAESLMRSRYTAFVLQRADYLLDTWHASQRPQAIDFDPDVKWLGLEVRQHRLLDANHAEVEFVARQKAPGLRAVRLHELSRFLKDGDSPGRWYYVDGDSR
jgi:SEC-C motif domain protein